MEMRYFLMLVGAGIGDQAIAVPAKARALGLQFSASSSWRQKRSMMD